MSNRRNRKGNRRDSVPKDEESAPVRPSDNKKAGRGGNSYYDAQSESGSVSKPDDPSKGVYFDQMTHPEGRDYGTISTQFAPGEASPAKTVGRPSAALPRFSEPQAAGPVDRVSQPLERISEPLERISEPVPVEANLSARDQFLEEEKNRFKDMREELEKSRTECFRKLEVLQKWAQEVEMNNNRVTEEMKANFAAQKQRVAEMEDSLKTVGTQRDDLLALVENYSIRTKRRVILLTRAMGAVHIIGGLIVYPALRNATVDLFQFGSLWDFHRAPIFAYLYKALSWASAVPLDTTEAISQGVNRLKAQHWALWFHSFGLYLISPPVCAIFGTLVLPTHIPIWATIAGLNFFD